MNDKCFLKYYNKIIPKCYQQCQELGNSGELSFICISLGSPPQTAFLLGGWGGGGAVVLDFVCLYLQRTP